MNVAKNFLLAIEELGQIRWLRYNVEYRDLYPITNDTLQKLIILKQKIETNKKVFILEMSILNTLFKQYYSCIDAIQRMAMVTNRRDVAPEVKASILSDLAREQSKKKQISRQILDKADFIRALECTPLIFNDWEDMFKEVVKTLKSKEVIDFNIWAFPFPTDLKEGQLDEMYDVYFKDEEAYKVIDGLVDALGKRGEYIVPDLQLGSETSLTDSLKSVILKKKYRRYSQI